MALMVLGTRMCVRGDPIEWHVILCWNLNP